MTHDMQEFVDIPHMQICRDDLVGVRINGRTITEERAREISDEELRSIASDMSDGLMWNWQEAKKQAAREHVGIDTLRERTGEAEGVPDEGVYS